MQCYCGSLSVFTWCCRRVYSSASPPAIKPERRTLCSLNSVLWRMQTQRDATTAQLTRGTCGGAQAPAQVDPEVVWSAAARSCRPPPETTSWPTFKTTPLPSRTGTTSNDLYMRISCTTQCFPCKLHMHAHTHTYTHTHTPTTSSVPPVQSTAWLSISFFIFQWPPNHPRLSCCGYISSRHMWAVCLTCHLTRDEPPPPQDTISRPLSTSVWRPVGKDEGSGSFVRSSWWQFHILSLSTNIGLFIWCYLSLHDIIIRTATNDLRWDLQISCFSLNTNVKSKSSHLRSWNQRCKHNIDISSLLSWQDSKQLLVYVQLIQHDIINVIFQSTWQV